MIYNISGEQPFQVLSDSFSVSPSESGYNLYLSADGVNYSQFATVAANTTRQFTGMNNGNYYILSGNTSEVQVNWNRDCGGGGGGGTAGVSSLNGQTGALTTKTVGGQSILGEGDIPISGGSGQFIIVDFDAMTQQERADLVTTLNALDSGGSGSTINQTYQFYRNISGPDGNNWYGARIQFYRTYYGRCVFGAMLTETDAQGHIPARTFEVNMWLAGDGSWEATNVYKFEAPSTKVVGLSQADYDALVQAGTVDANTLYVII